MSGIDDGEDISDTFDNPIIRYNEITRRVEISDLLSLMLPMISFDTVYALKLTHPDLHKYISKNNIAAKAVLCSYAPSVVTYDCCRALSLFNETTVFRFVARCLPYNWTIAFEYDNIPVCSLNDNILNSVCCVSEEERIVYKSLNGGFPRNIQRRWRWSINYLKRNLRNNYYAHWQHLVTQYGLVLAGGSVVNNLHRFPRVTTAIQDFDLYNVECDSWLHFVPKVREIEENLRRQGFESFKMQLHSHVVSDNDNNNTVLNGVLSHYQFFKGYDLYVNFTSITPIFNSSHPRFQEFVRWSAQEKQTYLDTNEVFLIKFQLLFSRFKDIGQIFSIFDIDICQVGWNGVSLVCSDAFKIARQSNTLISYKANNFNGRFANRVIKYTRRYQITPIFPKKFEFQMLMASDDTVLPLGYSEYVPGEDNRFRQHIFNITTACMQQQVDVIQQKCFQHFSFNEDFKERLAKYYDGGDDILDSKALFLFFNWDFFDINSKLLKVFL